MYRNHAGSHSVDPGNDSKNRGRKRKIRVVISVLCTGVLLAGGVQAARQASLQQSLAGKVLRFHVRANSNSVSDQILKYQVRDEVAAYLQEELAEADSLSESRQVVTESLEEIENTARSVLEAEGSSYSVKASVGEEWFPQKSYGSFCFPQGNYEALVVEIGSGAGRNWWCVMYPNLCFSGSVYEVDETGKELKEVLDEKEYRQIIQNKDYKVRFKGLNNFRKEVKIER